MADLPRSICRQLWLPPTILAPSKFFFPQNFVIPPSHPLVHRSFFALSFCRHLLLPPRSRPLPTLLCNCSKCTTCPCPSSRRLSRELGNGDMLFTSFPLL